MEAGFSEAQEHSLARKKSRESSAYGVAQCSTNLPSEMRNRPTDEIRPFAVEAMEEVGIDLGDHYPKGLRIYVRKMGFNYSIIVCARAEMDCPKTFPGVGTGLV